MDFCKPFAGFQAAEDQTLQVFKKFYLGAGASDRQKFYEYVCQLKSASMVVPVERMPRESIKNRVIGIQVSCQLFEDGEVASINANTLCEALETWARDEEYAPQDPLE